MAAHAKPSMAIVLARIRDWLSIERVPVQLPGPLRHGGTALEIRIVSLAGYTETAGAREHEKRSALAGDLVRVLVCDLSNSRASLDPHSAALECS